MNVDKIIEFLRDKQNIEFSRIEENIDNFRLDSLEDTREREAERRRKYLLEKYCE